MTAILAMVLASLLSPSMLAQTKKPVQKRPIAPTSIPTSIPTAQPMAPPPTSTPFVWQQEPKAFRGVAWGTSEKDAKKRLDCIDVSGISSGKVRSCMSSFNLGSVSVTATLKFLDDKFAAVIGEFRSEGYQTVRTAFVEKYGPPMWTKTSTVQNRMNASFEQENLMWAGPEVAIALDRLGDRVTKGFFLISTQEFLAASGKASEEAKKKLKDAL